MADGTESLPQDQNWVYPTVVDPSQVGTGPMQDRAQAYQMMVQAQQQRDRQTAMGGKLMAALHNNMVEERDTFQKDLKNVWDLQEKYPDMQTPQSIVERSKKMFDTPQQRLMGMLGMGQQNQQPNVSQQSPYRAQMASQIGGAKRLQGQAKNQGEKMTFQNAFQMAGGGKGQAGLSPQFQTRIDDDVAAFMNEVNAGQIDDPDIMNSMGAKIGGPIQTRNQAAAWLAKKHRYAAGTPQAEQWLASFPTADEAAQKKVIADAQGKEKKGGGLLDWAKNFFSGQHVDHPDGNGTVQLDQMRQDILAKNPKLSQQMVDKVIAEWAQTVAKAKGQAPKDAARG